MLRFTIQHIQYYPMIWGEDDPIKAYLGVFLTAAGLMPKFSPAWPLDSFRGLPRKSLWLWPLCSMSGIFQHLPQISPGCGEKYTMDHASYYHIIRTWNIWGSETCLDFSVIWGKTRKICGKNNSGKLLVTPEQTLHPCWLTRQISGLLLWHEVNFSEHKAKLGTTHGPGLRQTHQNWKIWATQIVTLLTYSSKKIHGRIDEQKCEHDHAANMIFPKLQTAFLFSREIPWLSWFGGSHRQLHRQQELSHDSYVGQLFVQVWLWPGCPVLTNCFLKFFTKLLFDLPLVIKQAWQWTIPINLLQMILKLLMNGNIIYLSVLSMSKKQKVPIPRTLHAMALSPKHFGWAARVVLYKANFPSHRLHANDQSWPCTQLTRRKKRLSEFSGFSLQQCKPLYIYIYTYIYIYMYVYAINHGVSCQQLWHFHGVRAPPRQTRCDQHVAVGNQHAAKCLAAKCGANTSTFDP